jgi:hypothetical protein
LTSKNKKLEFLVTGCNPAGGCPRPSFSGLHHQHHPTLFDSFPILSTCSSFVHSFLYNVFIVPSRPLSLLSNSFEIVNIPSRDCAEQYFDMNKSLVVACCGISVSLLLEEYK